MLDLSSFLSENAISYPINGEMDSKDLPERINLTVNSPIGYKGDIYKVGKEYQLHITINYAFDSNCDRCLKPTSSKVETVLSGKLVSDTGKFNDEDELNDIIFYEDDRLNIKEYVWNQVVSSLPMKILCNNECKGLCHTCGMDLNAQSCDCMGNTIDPRLEKLKDLFSEK